MSCQDSNLRHWKRKAMKYSTLGWFVVVRMVTSAASKKQSRFLNILI